jgi:phosphoribosylglycinamide formyltransferase-1
VLEQEHRIYPLALRLLAEGRLHVTGAACHVRGAQGPDAGPLVNPVG